MAEYDSAIPPGGSGTVIAKVRTRGRQGRQSKTVRVETNDPTTPFVTLRLTFVSQPAIDVLPTRTVTFAGFAGQKHEVTLLLRRADGEPLQVLEASSTRPNVSVVAEPVGAVEPPIVTTGRRVPPARPGDWRLRVNVEGTEPRSEAGKLIVRTNHPQQPELTLPLRIQLRGLVETQPRSVRLRQRTGERPVSSQLVVRHNNHRPFQIERVEFEGELPRLEAEIPQQEPTPVHRLEIRLQDDAPPSGSYQGRLIVHTNLRRVPQLEVPVTVRVDAAAAAPSSPAAASATPNAVDKPAPATKKAHGTIKK
ncbi:MAG: hypothetical protein JSV80_13010 [Acidobacteriota bacterium]|nr:MAG: hypothetical protein JSV80_13010 [Acidobacteriota bacterium]